MASGKPYKGAIHVRYLTKGTCSKAIDLEIDPQGIITACSFTGGCRGNAQGLSQMVIGQKAEEVSQKLRGIPCQGNTSCPDQLSHAIEEYLQSSKE